MTHSAPLVPLSLPISTSISPSLCLTFHSLCLSLHHSFSPSLFLPLFLFPSLSISLTLSIVLPLSHSVTPSSLTLPLNHSISLPLTIFLMFILNIFMHAVHAQHTSITQPNTTIYLLMIRIKIKSLYSSYNSNVSHFFAVSL